MKTIGLILLAAGIVFYQQPLHAQTGLVGSFNNDLAPVQTAPPDSIVQITAEAQGLPTVAYDNLPPYGTFWEMLPSGLMPPMPCRPTDPTLPIYAIADNIFIVDATGGQVTVNARQLGTMRLTRITTSDATESALEAQATAIVNLINQVQDAQFYEDMAMVFGLDSPLLGGGGDYTPDGITNSYVAPDYGPNLWIAQQAEAGGYLTGIGTNTQAGIEYEIQSRTNLLQTDWQSEGFILGSELTNWTPLSVAQNSRPDLFIRLRSWADDGSGLPIWWQLQYFETTGIDPDAFDSAGDGYTIWQKFEMGLDPNAFYSPPAPQRLMVAGNPTSSTAIVSWQPAKGAVTGYTVGRFDLTTYQWQTFNVGLNNQFVDTTFIQYPPWSGQIFYSVQANYASGNSYWSPDAESLANNTATAQVLSGAGGSTVLMVLNLPADAAGVQATRVDWNTYLNYPQIIGGTNTFYIPASSFVNGLYTVPTNAAGLGSDGSTWYVQTVWSNGVAGAQSTAFSAGYLEVQTTYGGIPGRFNDASTQLEQNAIFLLRAAGLTGPFIYEFDAGYGVTPVYPPASYAYASFWNDNYDTGDGLGGAAILFWGLPLQENYRLRNFAFAAANVDSTGKLTTGAAGWQYLNDGSSGVEALVLQAPFTFYYSTTNTAVLPGLLAPSQTTWITPYSAPTKVGITTGSGQFSLPNNIYNYFGLKLLSVLVAHNHNSTLYLDTLNAGGSLPATNDTYYFYPQYDQPQLQTTGYYFGKTDNEPTPNGGILDPDPLPGNNLFSPTNAQPLLLASVGTPFQVAAFARQTIVNGDPGKPVYVSQYFDKAYKVDARGNVTTTQTGVLSPYVNFLPTEPGPVALVTLPSSDGQRGTGIVQVVSLVLDANHDGNMDATLAGADFTSASHPMPFWVNDLYDQPGSGATLDQTLPVNPTMANTSSGQIQPNYAFGQIRCQRNLENFARLWIRGLPSLPASQGYSVTLNEDFGSSGEPVNLYAAYEVGGGTGYLTDTNLAAAQVVAPYGNELAQLTYWNPDYVLPEDNQGNLVLTNFLFEGTGVGPVGLVLSVYQNGSLIGQTEAYVNFDEVKNFYEQAEVTDVVQTWPEMVQTNVTSGFQVLASPPANPYEAKQLAVFVHGWRMTAWDTENFSDTMFKRLYWQGYQGRFASLRWPTRSKNTDTNSFNLFGTQIPADTLTFNRSEHIAFDSGAGAAAYFNNLRSRYTNYTISVAAHSQGNVVMMEALKELATASQSPLDNYVMMQAAVPAHCYDTTVPNFPAFTNEEQFLPTPNIYANYGTGIDNAMRGKIFNFFNTNDYALVSASTNATLFGINFPINTSWIANEQLAKPLVFFGYSYNPANSIAYLTNVSEGVTGRTVTDPFELMPFVARPRSLAVGSQGGVNGMVNGGGVDLIPFGFTKDYYDHSGEFNRNIQTPQVQIFYINLVLNLFP